MSGTIVKVSGPLIVAEGMKLEENDRASTVRLMKAKEMMAQAEVKAKARVVKKAI